ALLDAVRTGAPLDVRDALRTHELCERITAEAGGCAAPCARAAPRCFTWNSGPVRAPRGARTGHAAPPPARRCARPRVRGSAGPPADPRRRRRPRGPGGEDGRGVSGKVRAEAPERRTGRRGRSPGRGAPRLGRPPR